MGRYHPHGDSAIYDALVRMGQSFSRGMTLIHPQGNFGSLDDPPAAPRYTECRLSEAAMAMVRELDEDTVGFRPTYDGESTEPTHLPALLPNLLLNGTAGIAVGMATNMPTHNLAEVHAAVTLVMNKRRPKPTVDELLAVLPGPDFPSGGIVVDAASGVSGAGRGPKPGTTFCAVDEDFSAYGLTGGTTDAPTGHRHTPEIEQAISTAADGSAFEATTGVSVLFTPHLAPMNRGILATCYAEPITDMDSAAALSVLADAYAGEPFIVVSERSPSTKATAGSNTAHLTARVDPRTGLLVVISAIDNLVKGASGQAVQCANIASGIDETTGLPTVGMYP